MAKPIYIKLRDHTPPDYYIVADTAFPRGVEVIDGHIRAPFKAGQFLQGTQEEIEYSMAFDHDLLSYRQTAEWGNRAIKSCWGRLTVPLEVAHKEQCANLLEICVRGHCLRTSWVGLNQIQSVYEPRWQVAGEDGSILDDLGSMLFSDRRSNDRVSRFHTLARYV